ncbi:MAG: response regulator [Candidatus Obscuribacter sp.]|nr:response regulator [Candidatus Obscuribacter sp.]MBP6592498.1 response regulator [Candidatus Obscuribacter sp.]
MTIKNTEILLVEDSPSDAELMASMLADIKEFPNHVQNVQTLSEAKQAIMSKSFDAVVLDLNLPDSNGLQTYTELRDVCNSVPIVILTGMDDREVLTHALKNGADNYLIKDKVDGGRVAIAILASIRNRLSV